MQFISEMQVLKNVTGPIDEVIQSICTSHAVKGTFCAAIYLSHTRRDGKRLCVTLIK